MKKLFCYLFLIGMAVIVFLGTGHKGIINNNDTCFQVFPFEELRLKIHTWYWRANLGEENYLDLLMLPYFVIKGLLDKIGLELWLINRLWFVGALFFMGSSMFYLTSIFFKNSDGTIPRIISSIFFMLNSYVFNRLSGGHIMTLYDLASIVYMLAFFIKGLGNSDKIHKYAILFAILSIFTGIVHRLTAALILGLYFLFYILMNIRKPEKIIYGFRFTLESAVLVFMMNCFWILPVLNAGTSNIVAGVYGDKGDWGSLAGTSPFVRIFWAVRLMYGIFAGLTPYTRYLNSPFGISIWFILIFTIYSVLLFPLKESRSYFFYILAIIATYLATGLNYPISSSVYTWLWSNFRPFQVFRNPEKFQCIILLSYSVMLCLFCKSVDLNFKKWSKVIYIIITILVVVNSWVFFTGNLLGEIKPVEIPDYYYDLRDYLKNDTFVRMLSLPIQWLLYNFSWAPYMMGNIVYNISPIAVIIKIPGEELTGFKEVLYRKFYGVKGFNNPWLYKLSNIKYVLLQNDLYSEDLKKLEGILDEGLGREYKDKKIFGKLLLYEVSDRYSSPFIYTSSRINWVSNYSEEYKILSYSQIFNRDPIIVFSKSLPRDISGARIIAFDSYADGLKCDDETIYVFQNKGNSKRNCQFYIPVDGDYKVQAGIGLNYFRKKYLAAKYLFGLSDEINTWSHNPVNTHLNYNAENSYLRIECLFDGDSTEDEFAQFNRRINGIDLKKYPWFGMYYKVDNPSMQTIEMVFGVDFNLDDNVDLHLRGLYPRPSSPTWNWYELNILSKAKELHPDELNYRLIEVEFYPHKLWGTDCSRERKGKYNFYIKELLFYRNSPRKYILDMDGRLVLPGDYTFSRDVFKIDNRSYNLEKKLSDGNEMIFNEKMWFKKGFHNLTFIEDDSFDTEWIMIEPEDLTLGNNPKVDFKKINPTKYILKVSDINGPFWLIFNETFNSGWQAFIKKGDRYKEVISHYKANGYANLWFVDTNKVPETEMLLNFYPQRLFNIGAFISIFGLAAGLLYLIIKGCYR